MNPRIVLLSVCIGLLLFGTTSAWYDSDWDYRKEFTVNNTGSALTNYQVMFAVNRSAGSDSGTTVYLDGKCEADYDDVRFVASDDTTVLDYWIESSSATVASVWVELNSLPTGDTDFYLYYCNPGASVVSNGTNTFPFFDDFNGDALDTTNNWDVLETISYSVSGGVCTLTAKAGTAPGIRAKSTTPNDFGYAFRSRFMASAETNFIGIGWSPSSFVTNDNRAEVHYGGVKCYLTQSTEIGYTSHTNDYTSFGVWDIMLTPGGGSVLFRYNGGTPVTRTTRLPASIQPVYFMTRNDGGAKTVSIDWVLVRNYAATEPTVSAWGSEESLLMAAIYPNFSGVPISGYVPLTVYFNDLSTSENCTITTWQWSFGDSTANSTQQNPAHTYTTSGLYNVILTITNTSFSLTNSTQKTGYINATINPDAPNADFTVTETCGNAGDTFYFIDYSTGGGLYAWNWSFGDGSYSELRNPTHQYASNGVYNVSLHVDGAYGDDTETKTDYITIPCTPSGLAPVVNFTANVTSGSIYPLVVKFTDTSTNTPILWNWSFGDGRYSTDQNPTYHYAVAGKYTVSLTSTNGYGANTTTKTDYINLTSDVDDYLVSWLHMNGTTGSTTFTGERGVNWMPSGAAQITSLVKYFGSGSGDFTGSKAYIYTVSDSAFDFGSNDFTIEMWVYIPSSSIGQTIVKRGNSAMTNGWGLYHSTNSASSDAWVFFMGSSSTNSTPSFSIPLNTWSHVVVTRESGVVKVYVNGNYITSKSGLGYSFDTTDPVYIAYNPPSKYYGGYVDEFRISNGYARWKTSFTTPYAEYRGVVETNYPDINPNSTMRYKTNPDSYAPIANQTDGGKRSRTIQIENVYNTSYVVGGIVYDPLYLIPVSVSLNTSTYSSGMVLESYSIDPEQSTIHFNVSRDEGFNNGTVRASIVETEYLYYNYTDQPFILNSFAYGYLINGTTTKVYPIHNFILTNMSAMPWNFTANFTANTTTQLTGSPVLFNSSFTGAYPNRWKWEWGDGTETDGTESNTSHIWYTNGLKTVTLTEYLWQNTSVNNVTVKVDYINITGENITAPTPTPTATPPSAINGTGIFNITESHGATWIQWNWIIPDAYTTTNYTYLRVMVDGEEKYNMSLTDSGDRSQEFTLSDVNANEYHRLELRYISLVDPTLEYVVGSDESVVKTDASIDYYLLLVVTGIGTFLFSLSVRNKVKALVVCSFSTALFLYLSVASMKSNVTLSTASLILASLTLFVILYLLYAIYKKYVLKEVTDV